MEIYLTIDEYMDTFFGFLSAIGSLAAGFAAIWAIKLAKGYLDEHKEKVKEENRQKLIIQCLKKSYDLKRSILQFYAIPNFSPFNEEDPYEIEKVVGSVIRHHRNQHSFFSEIDSSLHEILAITEILNEDELINAIRRIGKVVRKLDSLYDEITDLANENSFEKAYSIIKSLWVMDKERNPKNLLNLSFQVLEFLSIDLVSLYHKGKIQGV